MPPIRFSLGALGATLILAGCATPPSVEKQQALTDDARKAAGLLIQTLGGELKQAIATGGLEGAIDVCKTRAPAIAADISSKTGFNVHRVSPKNRNPNNVPDAWEARVQAELEQRLSAGEKPETLETWQVVGGLTGQTYRYAKGLPVQAVCLNCHGENIVDTVKAKLAAAYPADKATGYKAGSLRGIVSIERRL